MSHLHDWSPTGPCWLSPLQWPGICCINVRTAETFALLPSPRLMKPHTCSLLWEIQSFRGTSQLIYVLLYSGNFLFSQNLFCNFKYCHQVQSFNFIQIFTFAFIFFGLFLPNLIFPVSQSISLGLKW